MRRLLVIGCAIGAGLISSGMPATAEDGSGGQDNVVYLHNTSDGNVLQRARTAIAFDAGQSVTNQNTAQAVGQNCTGCRTVAVAVQVIIVEGYPSNFQPQNLALALNDNCTSCATFAYAYQYVLQPGHRVTISESGQERIDHIRRQIDQVTRSGLDFPTMSAKLDGLSAQLVQVTQQEMRANGDDEQGSAHRDVHEEG